MTKNTLVSTLRARTQWFFDSMESQTDVRCGGFFLVLSAAADSLTMHRACVKYAQQAHDVKEFEKKNLKRSRKNPTILCAFAPMTCVFPNLNKNYAKRWMIWRWLIAEPYALVVCFAVSETRYQMHGHRAHSHNRRQPSAFWKVLKLTYSIWKWCVCTRTLLWLPVADKLLRDSLAVFRCCCCCYRRWVVSCRFDCLVRCWVFYTKLLHNIVKRNFRCECLFVRFCAAADCLFNFYFIIFLPFLFWLASTIITWPISHTELFWFSSMSLVNRSAFGPPLFFVFRWIVFSLYFSIRSPNDRNNLKLSEHRRRASHWIRLKNGPRCVWDCVMTKRLPNKMNLANGRNVQIVHTTAAPRDWMLRSKRKAKNDLTLWWRCSWSCARTQLIKKVNRVQK